MNATTETRMPTDIIGDGLPAAAPAGRRRLLQDPTTMSLAALVFGLWAMAASVFAVALAAKAANDAGDAARTAPAAGTGAPAATTTVQLTEFAIAPGAVTVAAGSTLRVENAGTIPHNLAVDGQSTSELAKDAAADLSLAGLAPGTYTMRCTVPGHEAAGMKGTLTIQ